MAIPDEYIEAERKRYAAQAEMAVGRIEFGAPPAFPGGGYSQGLRPKYDTALPAGIRERLGALCQYLNNIDASSRQIEVALEGARPETAGGNPTQRGGPPSVDEMLAALLAVAAEVSSRLDRLNGRLA